MSSSCRRQTTISIIVNLHHYLYLLQLDTFHFLLQYYMLWILFNQLAGKQQHKPGYKLQKRHAQTRK